MQTDRSTVDAPVAELGSADERSPAGPGGSTAVRIVRFLRIVGRPRVLAVFIGLTVVASVLEAAVLLLIVAGASGVLVDDAIVVDAGPISAALALNTVLVLSLAGTVTLVALQLAAGFVSARLGGDFLTHVRYRLIECMLEASSERQATVTPARLQELVSNQAFHLASLLATINRFTTAAVAFVAMVVTAILVDPLTAGALAVVGVLLAFVFRPLGKMVLHSSQTHLADTHSYVARVADIMGVLPEIRVYGVTERAEELHRDSSDRVAEAYVRMRIVAVVAPVLYLGMLLLILVAGVYVLSRRSSTDVGAAGAIVLVLLRGLRYSQTALTNWQTAIELLPLVDDYVGVQADLRRDDVTRGDGELQPIRSLRLDGVGYRYPSDDVGLVDIDLEIEPGQVVGLAGHSGAGKTTLAHVILGLRQPTTGAFLVNGERADVFEETSWFSRFAYVPQHPLLIDGDVRENVRFMRENISDEHVTRALSRAAMDSDIALWGGGETRHVGVAGGEVSGGQRQRIAIARALAGEPDVLVLDEPTSALDPDAELIVRDTLEQLRGQLTVVLIAHRESTLSVCDVVVRMREGRIESVRKRDASAVAGVPDPTR